METKKAIFGRHAVRHFKDEPISDDDIKDIIHTAQQAPSWIDAQEARVYAASGDTLAKIRKEHAQLNHDVNVNGNAVIPLLPVSKWDQTSQDNMSGFQKVQHKHIGPNGHGDESDNLFYAPNVVYLTLPKHHSEWSVFDLGLLAQNIMVAAYDKGIDSMPAFEFVKYPKHLGKNLNIKDNEEVVMGLGLGYEDPNADINNVDSPRMDVNDILHFKK
ncbi:nitroreductase [Philodulcilactobacillus myokoensis]|uniref:Nitroreductase n=1 Tax=Philodulcilactobacillus myokoensis TaxID=2929573 RepID=A0A9W6ESN6_9LACO|nr:nitroreductase [Philodulcilactobacillus myokoensis]GLB46329.1 nitroreductase [Philodulcilactobacillus myokoensis]